MRKAYRILAYAIAVEVVIQAMSIALGLTGFGKWIDDGATVTKKVLDDNPTFTGSIVAFFAKIPGGARWAGYILGLIVVQVVLGIVSAKVPYLITLHVLNAFAILGIALVAARRAESTATTAREATSAAT
jgi:hypothetical protein